LARVRRFAAPVPLAIQIIFAGIIVVIIIVIRGTAFIHSPTGSGAVQHLPAAINRSLPSQPDAIAQSRVQIVQGAEAALMKTEINRVRVEMADKIGAESVVTGKKRHRDGFPIGTNVLRVETIAGSFSFGFHATSSSRCVI
jgi:hypothetical protein